MKNIQTVQSRVQLPIEPRIQLFRYHIDRNIAENNKKSMFFRRLNRFRFNTFNSITLMKFLKLKGPICVGFLSAITFQLLFKQYQELPQKH